jgi:thiol-disulfide isomerase/thioredoxin
MAFSFGPPPTELQFAPPCEHPKPAKQDACASLTTLLVLMVAVMWFVSYTPSSRPYTMYLSAKQALLGGDAAATEAITITSVEELKNALSSSECAFVLFYADWCPHCVKSMPVFMEKARTSKCKVFRVEHSVLKRDGGREIMQEHDVTYFPCLLHAGGGAVSKASLEKFVADEPADQGGAPLFS